MMKLIEQGKFNPAVLDEQEQIMAIRYGITSVSILHEFVCE